MKKHRGIVFKLISCFLVAVIIPLAFLSTMTLKKSHAILEDNMALTSFQTLKESSTGFSLYLTKLGQQLNILTRKNELKHMEDKGNIEDNADAIEDSIVAALKTTEGAVRGYYATNSGKVVKAWYTVEDTKSIGHHTLENADYTTKEWFSNSIGSDEREGIFAVFTEPYVDEETGKTIITVSQEVKASKVQVGCVALDIEFNVIEDFVKNIDLLNTGFVLLTNENGDILVNNDRNTYLTSSLSELADWDTIAKQDQTNQVVSINGESVNVITFTDSITHWKIVGFINQSEIADSLHSILSFTIIAALIAIIFGILIGILVTARIKLKLNYINHAASSVAHGDLSHTIKLSGNDEFTDLCRNFNAMTRDIARLISNVDKTSNSALNACQEIAAITTQTSTAAKNVFVSISEVAESTSKQAYRIQEASANVDDLSYALEQMKKFLTDKLHASASVSLSAADVQVLNKLIEKVNECKGIAIARVENIAADSEEVASAAEEVTELTQEVSQSMTILDDHNVNLQKLTTDLRSALSRFKLSNDSSK